VVYSIYLGYHTLNQVLAGSMLGLVIGAAWYSFIQYVLRPRKYLQWLLNTAPFRWLDPRDLLCSTTASTNGIQYEHVKQE
jgi:dolichyldiphosphatase